MHPKSGGQKKKRGITGATGAAGSIMAANISNMGYNYPAVSGNEVIGAGTSFGDSGHLRTADHAFKDPGGLSTKESHTAKASGISGYMQPSTTQHRQSPQSYSHMRHIHRADPIEQKAASHTSSHGQRRVALLSGGKQDASRSSINASNIFNAEFEIKQASVASAKSSGNTFHAMALKKNQSNAHAKKSAKQRGMSGLVAGSAVNRMVTDMLK